MSTKKPSHSGGKSSSMYWTPNPVPCFSERSIQRLIAAGKKIFMVIPDLPADQHVLNMPGTNKRPYEYQIVAYDADEAIRRAVRSGVIPSNSVVQYYKAVDITPLVVPEGSTKHASSRGKR